MRTLSRLALASAVLAAAGGALADTHNGPDPYAAGFGFDRPDEATWGGWARGDANTLYAEWDRASDASFGASNDRTTAADLGSANTDSTKTFLGWNSGTFVTSSQNLYSFSVAPAITVKIDEATPLVGPLVKVAIQTEEWGTPMNPASMLLNGIAADASFVTFTDPAYASPFGPVTLNHRLFTWTIATPMDYTFTFNAAGSSMSLTQVAVDVMAVPEPGTWAMLAGGLALVAGVARRRRG
jgi:hypothetical protein